MIEFDVIKNFPMNLIGLDEVGRGPLCGPVVIGAVHVRIENEQDLKEKMNILSQLDIGDSKKVSIKKRSQILQFLGFDQLEFRKIKQKDDVSVVAWDIDHKTIEKMNILHATLYGMKEAAFSLLKSTPTTLLIDGHQALKWDTDESKPWEEMTFIKGDSRSVLIGLASLLAKEKRDQYMRKMHEKYPQYGLYSNFGYPTPQHLQAIKDFGPCPIHRKTFKGVKEHIRS